MGRVSRAPVSVGDTVPVRSQQKILAAALGLIEGGGFEAVNIAAVATAAGVSRQTVYSIFGTREEVVSQAMGGLAIEVLGEITAQVESVDTACDYVLEFIVAARTAVRAHPVLATLLLAERGNPVFDVEMMSRAIPFATQMLTPMVERGLATDVELDEIVEIAVRLGLSVVAFDSELVHSDDSLRAFLARWLGPAIRSTS